LGAVQFQVAQNRLDAGQVGAAEQQMGGAGVAQMVEANRFAEELKTGVRIALRAR
jgi:hypothetical protein